MSTTARNLRLTTTPGEPLAHGRSDLDGGAFGLAQFISAHAGLTTLLLSVAYVVVLAALSMVLAASMVQTVVGTVVVVAFGAVALLLVAIGIYVVSPE